MQLNNLEARALPAGSTAELPRERRRLCIRGLVQGVGFRPHVYRCAARLGVTGFVRNGPEGVIVEVEGVRLDGFVAALRREAPGLARIDSIIETPLAVRGDSGFSIAPSAGGAAAGAAIPADTAICANCLQELFDPADRRFLHPFIACCDCGPRYTMTRRLPYDRDSTSMADFDLCDACQEEYTDPLSRRFHAEPVACPECGPQLVGGVGQLVEVLLRGDIAALKGVGGYHLACDARDHGAVQRLRARKHRDGKPFAVMVLNAASAARHVVLDDSSRRALASPERPVVVLPRRGAATGLSPDVSPGLATLGLILPYSGLHYLLFHALLGMPGGRRWLGEDSELALVMTSANLSGDPLITSRQEAETRLAGIADYQLHHDREIAARVDDSVLRVSDGVTTVIRRARGYAPHAVKLASSGPRVLALGAHLKSTVTLTRGNRAYISPHVGDLDTPAARAFHAESARALQAILQSAPERLACDLHPDYASTRLAEQMSEELELPLLRVQHHHAHSGAVLAEHRHEDAALAVALDGHGRGGDGGSWGGELLFLEGGKSQRVGHFSPLYLPGGDTAAREPWRMAAGALQALGRGGEIPSRFSGEALAPALAAVLAAGDAPVTTAAGRLFDTAAGLLGVSRRAAFEGEPPMILEGLVRDLADGTGAFELRDGVLDFTPLLAELADCDDAAGGAERLHGAVIAGVVDWVVAGAERTGTDTVALCGGCFLNSHLAREIPPRLEQAGLRVLLPRSLPPNDGAISLGQAWVAQRSDL